MICQIDCLNGDKYRTGKVTPEGEPDPSVFSTDQNREGIRVGTAVCVMVRKEERDKEPMVGFRDFWGATKRQDLLATLGATDSTTVYKSAIPCKENRFSFRPEEVSEEYRSWPSVAELGGSSPYLGLNENRGGALQEIDRQRIESRMSRYLDTRLSWEEYQTQETGLTKKAAGFHPESVRKVDAGFSHLSPRPKSHSPSCCHISLRTRHCWSRHSLPTTSDCLADQLKHFGRARVR